MVTLTWKWASLGIVKGVFRNLLNVRIKAVLSCMDVCSVVMYVVVLTAGTCGDVLWPLLLPWIASLRLLDLLL